MILPDYVFDDRSVRNPIQAMSCSFKVKRRVLLPSRQLFTAPLLAVLCVYM
jgi:hypothetical protein